METFARGLDVARVLLQRSALECWRAARCARLDTGPGAACACGERGLWALCEHAGAGPAPTQRSGRQDACENLLKPYLLR